MPDTGAVARARRPASRPDAGPAAAAPPESSPIAAIVAGSLAALLLAAASALTLRARGALGRPGASADPVPSERLPGRVSHGCIRMRNADVLRLARLMPGGTPLKIR